MAPEPFEVTARSGNVLRGDTQGEGPVILQLHGLTAARRYVVHGSRQLEREGFRSIAYDARGHGLSDPAIAGDAYNYPALAADLADVVAAVADQPVVLAGHSMGAHTIARFALDHPEAIAGLVLAGPAARGVPASPESVAYWDRLSNGLREGGVDGFIAAYDDERLHAEWRETLLRLARTRLALHSDLGAVADALAQVPRSRPFDGIDSLAAIEPPALIVASRDEADSGHPYAIAEAWAEAIPKASMICEEEGESPLAWQGGKLSREIAAFARTPAVVDRIVA